MSPPLRGQRRQTVLSMPARTGASSATLHTDRRGDRRLVDKCGRGRAGAGGRADARARRAGNLVRRRTRTHNKCHGEAPCEGGANHPSDGPQRDGCVARETAGARGGGPGPEGGRARGRGLRASRVGHGRAWQQLAAENPRREPRNLRALCPPHGRLQTNPPSAEELAGFISLGSLQPSGRWHG